MIRLGSKLMRKRNRNRRRRRRRRRRKKKAVYHETNEKVGERKRKRR